MINIPVLRSKLIIPELSASFLLTDRLRRLHQSMDSGTAVTICAPAGYGKTTLAVSYFRHQAAGLSRVGWYRLDPEDNNPSVFIAHLAEALLSSEAAVLAELRTVLGSQMEHGLQPQQALVRICQELWTRYRQAEHTRNYLVLDDFHNVTKNQDICDMTRYMLDNLPPSWSIFVLSRAPHEVFTEKQKLEKRIIEIKAADLAFSNWEIEELMLNMGHPAANKELTDAIAKTTEGWIAGIIILWQALGGKNCGTPAIESNYLPDKEALFRYMSLEVLKSVPGDIQDALARIAILQDFSGLEAAEILQIYDIQSLMEQCLGFGVFIQRIPGHPVVYRFHSLFREFLLHILKDRYAREQIEELHLKAANYYMEHAIYGRAAEHLAECGDSAAAIQMVTEAGFKRLMVGETAQLRMWLDLLPEDMIRDNPVLLMFKAQLMPNRQHPQIVDTLKRVLELSLQDNNFALYYDAASVLIYIYMCSNNMKELRNMTKGFPSKLSPVAAELECTPVIIYMVRAIGEGRLSAAAAFSESITYTQLSVDNQWLYLILSCIVYYCLGKLDQAQQCMEAALILDRYKNVEPAQGFILLYLATVLSLKNETGCLPSYISEVIAIGEKYDYEYLSAHGNRLAALERYLSFDAEASLERLSQAELHFLHINNKAMAAMCRLLRTLWSLKPNGCVPDLEECRQDLAIIRKSSPGLMVYEISLSIMGAIARESGDFHLAESLLLSALKAAKSKKAYHVLCGAGFHIARLYYTIEDMEKGHHYLRQAMDLAASHRYFMFWDIHWDTMTDMSLRSIRYGFNADHASAMLIKFFDRKTAEYLQARAKSLEESQISAFCNEFVSSYQTGSLPQLYFVKASLFGKPAISVNGINIPDTEWKTKKVKGFLEYLLLGSGTTMSKETLAEIFWPESDSKSALASQRTALYHLRKVMAKYNAEVTGDKAFIYETPEGLQIRRNEILELDIHEFVRLYSELSKVTGSTNQDEQKKVALLEKMMAVYEGDLMDGNDYGELVLQERERFKSIFIDACQKLSSIYIKRGELGRAEELLKRALAGEPYNENICLELLHLYMSQGRRSKAAKLYYSFKKRLEQDLDIKVDKRLSEAIASRRQV